MIDGTKMCLGLVIFDGTKGNRKIPVDQKIETIAIFDDFDYPKIPTLQPHIGSSNGMHRNDAGAMTNCSMWFGTVKS